ncbi:MAG TPA: MFS transporter [Mycobacteriales bacterium]|nr:MFS transporter [Mycobacteriales bacterium]
MSAAVSPAPPSSGRIPYKWIALSNTTLGILMATINSSILMIALPDIFRGIHLNPLAPGNTPYFLWILMGFLLVTSVLVVSLGRVGDIYGRVRMFNLGFAIFTAFSALLSITWLTGTHGALWIVLMRLGQGVGGACILANSSAIVTDAFPETERGLALSINGVAAISGSFIGLVLGGLLAPVSWRLVFIVSVPLGLAGTLWSYLKLRDNGIRTPAKIDWIGNLLFAAGLIGVLLAIVYGLEPYGGHTMGWTKPFVLACGIGGLAILALFVVVENHVKDPMFRLHLFKSRTFTMGNVTGLLAGLSRGGLMFTLIIWLQGIWLPQHGYSFERTPLWAGIYMVPLTVGFLISGPISGRLTDRFGPKPFATAGMALSAVCFLLFDLMPMNFNYVWFALLLLAVGLSLGLFFAPNIASVMNATPASQRGAGAGMLNTFQNSAQVLSIGIFFTVITLGLASGLPHAMQSGLVAQGMPVAQAHSIANLPPIGTLFAAFLGYNPIQQLIGSASAAHVSAAHYHYLTGRSFFPSLITGPFGHGLHLAMLMAAGVSIIGMICSALRGSDTVEGRMRSGAESVEAGIAGAGDEVMAEVGAGAALEAYEE